MHPTRLEINFRRLLAQCEKLTAEKENPNDEWRLEKYIDALEEMYTDLEKNPNSPKKEVLNEYVRKIEFLRGVFETSKLPTATEKIVAAQLISHGPATTNEPVTKEIHQKTTAKYDRHLREELLGKNSGVMLRQRTSGAVNEDVDAVLHYHHNMQEKIADHMLSLTRSLKEQSIMASQIVNKDTEKLEKSSHLADTNYSKLKTESVRLEEYNKRAWKCWIWLMFAAVTITFIGMVFFMRLFRKKT